MLLKGDIAVNGRGEKYEVVAHWVQGKFPVLAKKLERGILEKFTNEGQYYQHRKSELDIRPLQGERTTVTG